MIELQQVSFAYPSRHPLFQDFNLSFPEGKLLQSLVQTAVEKVPYLSWQPAC